MQWIPALMFMTFVAAIAFAMVHFFLFLQRRSHRQIAGDALTGTQSRTDHGALPEIAGIGAVALVAIALLTFGYHGRSDTKPVAGETPPVTTGASPTDRMTDQARPRANPADISQPPTQYPLGSGAPNVTPPTKPTDKMPAQPPAAQ